jgi:hypothetical protein
LYLIYSEKTNGEEIKFPNEKSSRRKVEEIWGYGEIRMERVIFGRSIRRSEIIFEINHHNRLLSPLRRGFVCGEENS